MAQKKSKKTQLVGRMKAWTTTGRREVPVFFKRSGLCIQEPLSRFECAYVLSAEAAGMALARFQRLEDVEAAFLAVEHMVDWRRVKATKDLDPDWAPKATRTKIANALRKHGAAINGACV